MVSFMEVMQNDKISSRFNIWTLISKEFIGWLRVVGTPPTPKTVQVITDNGGRQVQGKRGMA